MLLAFLIIPVTLSLAFTLYPAIEMFRLGFTDWDGASSIQNYVKLDNYIKIIFHSPDVWNSLKYNLIYLVMGLLFIPIQMIFATMLNSKLMGANFFKSIIFVPYIINGVAISYAFTFFLSPENGALNGLLKIFGLDWMIQSWLSNVHIVNFTLASILVWRNFGFFVVLFISGLSSIPKDIIEAAVIDGANAVQRFFYVIIPTLRRIIEIVLFMTITWSLQIFDIPFVMTSGGPGSASSTFSLYTITTAFRFNSFGLASSMGTVMILIIVVIVFVQNRIMKKVG